MGLMFFMGCDKIIPEEYTIYDGAAVKWLANADAVTQVQRV